MRCVVDGKCVGCGLCARLCPDVFYMGEDGFARAISQDVPQSALSDADAAYDDCPMEAIRVIMDRPTSHGTR